MRLLKLEITLILCNLGGFLLINSIVNALHLILSVFTGLLFKVAGCF